MTVTSLEILCLAFSMARPFDDCIITKIVKFNLSGCIHDSALSQYACKSVRSIFYGRCSCGGNYRSVIDAAAATNNLPHELLRTVAAKRYRNVTKSWRRQMAYYIYSMVYYKKNLCEGLQEFEECLSCVYCLGNDRFSCGGKTKTL
jgi:hypothetical protein